MAMDRSSRPIHRGRKKVCSFCVVRIDRIDSNGQLALMESASAGDAAGNDFGTLADVFAQAGQILVINAVDAINAEAANLFAAAE